MNSEIPSRPTVYRIPHAGIHSRSSWNCMPAAGTNVHHSGTEIANSARLAASATCFAQRAGTSSTSSAASAGQAISAVSTPCWYMAPAPRPPPPPLPHRRAEHGEHADHEQHDVEAHLACLQPAADPPERARRGGRTVDEEAVHQ